MKYLVVDDDPRTRDLIKAALAGPGIEFLEGKDGSEAIALYEVHQPDWVIMDLEMKPVDGIVATQTIQRQYPHSRVVIVSNFDSLRFGKAARAAGACAYVLKDELHDLRNILAATALLPPEGQPARQRVE